MGWVGGGGDHGPLSDQTAAGANQMANRSLSGGDDRLDGRAVGEFLAAGRLRHPVAWRAGLVVRSGARAAAGGRGDGLSGGVAGRAHPF